MRWRRYLERATRDDELSLEIAHYIAQETDDNVARGMSHAEARRAALRRSGTTR